MKTAVSLVQLHSQTGKSPPSDTYPLLDTEIYQIFREYLQHEDGLANNRLSWMLTIHGFLYASYAFTIQTKIQIAQRISSDLLTSGADSAGHAGSYPVSFLIASIWQVDSVILVLVQIPCEIDRPSEVHSPRFTRYSATLRPFKVEAGI